MSQERVVIAQCTKLKRDEACPARKLYDESQYFTKQRAYAETADEWFIQSAEYGLVRPDEVIPPYDTSAYDLSQKERQEWAEEIAQEIAENIPSTAIIELLGGERYTEPLTDYLSERGYIVEEPLEGLGIGERNRKLNQLVNTDLTSF